MPLPRVESSRVPGEALSNLLDVLDPSQSVSDPNGTPLVSQSSGAPGIDGSAGSSGFSVTDVRQHGWILRGKQLRLPNGKVIGRPYDEEPESREDAVAERLFNTEPAGTDIVSGQRW